MAYTLKNERGFALALIMALLPALIGAVLVSFAIVSFVQMDLKMKHICRTEGLQGQERVAPLLGALLALNPTATALRLELIQARLQAISRNPAAIAYLKTVEMKVRSFEIKQQQLIQQSNLLLRTANFTTYSKLWREKQYITGFLPLFQSNLQVFNSPAPRLAVRPDSPDSPPTYSPTKNFSNDQALAHRWQYQLSIIKPLKPFLNGSFKFEKNCVVTLRKEGLEWVSQIKKDKSSSKSL